MPSPRFASVLAILALVAAPATAVTTNEGDLLTSLVATAAAKDPGFDVLTRDDIKNALAVEGDKQALGCEASSCLAELAGAMGARVVVYGSVGRLGTELLLTLNLFDSEKGSSGGRRIAQASDISGVAGKIDTTTTELLQAFLKSGATAPGVRVKLLVLDLEVKDVPSPSETPPDPPATTGPPFMAVAGGGVAALGVVGLGVGVWFDIAATSADAAARSSGVTQKEAVALFDESETNIVYAALSYGVGAVVALIGVGVAVAGLVTE